MLQLPHTDIVGKQMKYVVSQCRADVQKNVFAVAKQKYINIVFWETKLVLKQRGQTQNLKMLIFVKHFKSQTNVSENKTMIQNWNKAQHKPHKLQHWA